MTCCYSVYNLRCRIAPAGAIVLPPPSAALGSIRDEPTAAQIEGRYDQSDDGDDDDDNDKNDPDDASTCYKGVDVQQAGEPIPHFEPDQCLFCGKKYGTFDKSLAHMAAYHSFIIPYQDYLAVDLETLVWYLHLVIYGYIECILCGTRRNSLEAVQQHMTAKGHCRFDISPDTEDFYEIPASHDQGSLDSAAHNDMPLRLSSGKLLGHRNRVHVNSIFDTTRRTTSPSADIITSSDDTNRESALTRRDERNMAILAARVSHLSTSDQKSLSHLPAYEVRSVLATRRSQLNRAKREDLVARSRVDKLGNKTLMRHFKNDVPGRANG